MSEIVRGDIGRNWRWRSLDRLRRAFLRRRLAAVPGGRHDRAQDAEAAGRVEVVRRAALADCPRWPGALATQHKDHRYYELVEDTIEPKFQYGYFVLKDALGTPFAVQPYFVADLDLVAGTGPRVKSIVDRARRAWPRFMRMRALMVGCAAGEGQLDGDDAPARRLAASLLLATVGREARAHKTGLIVLKEFAADHRKSLECFRQHGFVRLPSLPMTSLDISYDSFDDYAARALSRATRKDLRRKFAAAARASPIEMSVLTDISPLVDEVFPLYLQVYERSNLHFEKLTPQYLCELGRRMPDKARFFVWRQDGRVVAASVCIVHGATIHDEYIGLDYAVALDLHLYHLTFRDIVGWAIANGYRRYVSNGLSYDPKLHLKCRLEPLDLYVRHTSPAIHWALALVLRLVEPTRYDKNLKLFSNYPELWGDR
jgi:hypothetical protein